MKRTAETSNRSLAPFRAALCGAIALPALAAADGPDYTNSPVTRECQQGVQDDEESVTEGADGRFARYGLEGRRLFDASGVTFDGLDDRNDFVHWPVKLSTDRSPTATRKFRALSSSPRAERSTTSTPSSCPRDSTRRTFSFFSTRLILATSST